MIDGGSSMNAPCKDCPKRYPGCHPECEEYLAYSREKERERRERRMRQLSTPGPYEYGDHGTDVAARTNCRYAKKHKI